MNENSAGAMIAFRPESADGLTVPGGMPPDELHVTMVYLGPDHTVYTEDHRAVIGQIIRDLAARIEAPITGVRTLGDDDPAATVLLLDSDELQMLRPVLRAAMVDAGVPVPEDTYPEFIPHITVGYGTPLEDASALVGQRVTLATLGVWFGPDRDEVFRDDMIEEAPMAQWRGVLARIGVPTGDKRIFAPDALTNRDLPLPLMWQRTSEGGHMGSVVIGRITSLEYSDGMVTGSGDFLDVPETYEARELIRSGVIGPSVDLDDMDYLVDEDETLVITRARIAGTTLVSIPAFADVSIHLTDQGDVYLDQAEAFYASADRATAVAYGVPDTGPRPSLEWFARPAFPGLTPLTVTPEGRVFGHVAPWEECHVGAPGCRTAPSSPSGYAYFLTGSQEMDGGATLPVGTLTVGGGHASPDLGFVAATSHYDDVGAAVAKVNCGEDEYGVWVSGWLLPWADPVRVEQFKSSPVSGDWRRIGGAMELIAVCSVNTPGFPVARTKARVSFAMGKQLSLQLALGKVSEGAALEAVDADSTLVRLTDSARARWAWTNRKGR